MYIYIYICIYVYTYVYMYIIHMYNMSQQPNNIVSLWVFFGILDMLLGKRFAGALNWVPLIWKKNRAMFGFGWFSDVWLWVDAQ